MYDLPIDYCHRLDIAPFDDTGYRDQWQREVYQYAADLARQYEYKTVWDIGCGSAYKLLKYVGHLDTVGTELPATLRWLDLTYPTRRWMPSNFRDPIRADLVICADVIEHLADPDSLLRCLLDSHWKRAVLSTPDRDLVRPPGDRGPPRNPHHAREWSFTEFRCYISRWLTVVEHRIVNQSQGTQMVVCRHPSL